MIVVVASYHRCYTSLTSQWLELCGFEFPGPLMGAGIGNQFGHYENLTFLKLSNEFNANTLSAKRAIEQFDSAFGDLHKSKKWFALKVPDAIPLAKLLLESRSIAKVVVPLRPKVQSRSSAKARLVAQLQRGVFRWSWLKRLPGARQVLLTVHDWQFSHRFDKHKTEIDSISRDSRVFILDFTKNDVSEKTLRHLGMVSMDGIDLDVQLNAALKAKTTT